MFIKFLLSIFICTATLFISTPTLLGVPAVLFFDVKEVQDVEPKNFRKCPEIKASGSAQFTEHGLKFLLGTLTTTHVVSVDLRQEPHGFQNETPVSWRRSSNWVFAGTTSQEIEENQKKRLEKLKNEKKNKKTIKAIRTEKELCELYKVSYLRIPVKDHHHPSDEDVNRFISYVTTLPENSWLHFHCFAGIGRTSLFLIMYDAMHNAKRDSLEQIVQRQVQLGGIDLLYQPEDLSTWKSNEAKRKAFLIKFYEYCKENSDNFQTAFSS